MMNVAGAVHAELLLVLHLLTASKVLNEFQNSENGFNTDAVCILQLFSAKSFVISLKSQESSLVFTLSFFLLPLYLVELLHILSPERFDK